MECSYILSHTSFFEPQPNSQAEAQTSFQTRFQATFPDARSAFNKKVTFLSASFVLRLVQALSAQHLGNFFRIVRNGPSRRFQTKKLHFLQIIKKRCFQAIKNQPLLQRIKKVYLQAIKELDFLQTIEKTHFRAIKNQHLLQSIRRRYSPAIKRYSPAIRRYSQTISTRYFQEASTRYSQPQRKICCQATPNLDFQAIREEHFDPKSEGNLQSIKKGYSQRRRAAYCQATSKVCFPPMATKYLQMIQGRHFDDFLKSSAKRHLMHFFYGISKHYVELFQRVRRKGFRNLGRAASHDARQSTAIDVRCENLRSYGLGDTGEQALPCGAVAEIFCEDCGPLCLPCAKQVLCSRGDHHNPAGLDLTMRPPCRGTSLERGSKIQDDLLEPRTQSLANSTDQRPCSLSITGAVANRSPQLPAWSIWISKGRSLIFDRDKAQTALREKVTFRGVTVGLLRKGLAPSQSSPTHKFSIVERGRP